MKSYGFPALCGLLYVTVCQADVTTDVLEAHLRSPALSQPRSHAQPQNKDTTRSYIVEQWGALAENQPGDEYTTTSDLAQLLDGQERVVLFSQRFDFSSPAQTGVNYVLIVKGSAWGTSDDKPIILATHYDSVTSSPGTDDNGSGVAAMLEVSKAIAADPTSNYSAIFVAFDVEEYGLKGSERFIQTVLVPRLLQHYGIAVASFQGALILDTIMNFDDTENSQDVPDGFSFGFPTVYAEVQANRFRGDFLLVAGRQDETALIDMVESDWDNTGPADVIGLTIPFQGNDAEDGTLDLIADFLRSDHKNFWLEDTEYAPDGIKALFITDTADFRGSMKECYHSECDNIDSISEKKLEFLLQVTQSLTRTLRRAMSADAAATPTSPTVTEAPSTTTTTKKGPVSSSSRALPVFATLSLLLSVLLM